MKILYVILATLFVKSVITLVIYWLSGENNDVIEVSGIGIIGWFLIGIFAVVKPISDYFRLRHNKRSIFLEESTGNKYICKTNNCENIRLWVKGYKLLVRYAPKEEWKGIPEFSKEFIEHSKRNCDYCKHDKECVCEYPYTKIKCKHDEFGTVVEFDKFERK